MHISIRFIFLILSCKLCGTFVAAEAAPICCFPKQFESLMFVANTGAQNPTGGLGVGFGGVNGTVKTAYDATNQRTYYLSKYTTCTSDQPGYINMNATVFVDYKQKVYYQVLSDIICDEGTPSGDIYVECIPNDAILLGEGSLADSDTMVQTYLMNFTMQGDKYQGVASVIQTDVAKGECLPVRWSVTNYPPDDDAFVVVSDTYDITLGIKDTSVFSKPPSCT